MTAAINAHGIQLQRGDGAATEVFATVAEVMEVTPPAVVSEMADVTAHDGAGWREFLPTILAMDEFSCTINYDPTGTTHADIVSDQIAGTLSNMKIIWPDGSSTDWEFAAYVTRFAPTAQPVDGVIQERLQTEIDFIGVGHDFVGVVAHSRNPICLKIISHS